MIFNWFLQIFKDISFKKKLLFSYLIVCIIPIMILGMYSYTKSKNYLQEQLKIGMTETVKQIAENINIKLQTQSEFIKFISYNPGLKEILDVNDIDSLDLANKLNDNIEPIIWYYKVMNKIDIQNVLIYSDFQQKDIGNFVKPNDTVKEKNWYKATRLSKDTLWWYENGELFATHSIQDRSNNYVVGVLYVSMDFQNIIESLKKSKLGRYIINLTDYYANRIYNNNNTEVLNATRLKDGSFLINNERYISIQSIIPMTQWTLCSYIPIKAATIETGDILKATGSVILVCILVLVFLVRLFSTTMVKRILYLSQMMENVEAGDLSLEIASNSKDEIGRLINKFGNMLKKINSLIDEVHKSHIAKKEAQLTSLQAQINPHFLYNSLSIINWKAIRANEKEISNVATSLASFYRTTLNKGRCIIRVQDEIENIKAYIAIQKIMHEDEFDFILEIDQNLMEYQMINFILQPIVENAIIHGIDEKEEGRGVLKIQAYLKDEEIVFLVDDNGPGIDTELTHVILTQQTEGYGLRNVNDRIKLYYGERYGMCIESKAPYGTVVTIHINKLVVTELK